MSLKNPFTGFKIRMEKMLFKGELGEKALFLAVDQGFEHRSDFTIPEAANPDYVMTVADKAGIPLILHKGLYIRYADRHPNLPMVIKINGKTELYSDNRAPRGGLDCSVDEALALCPTLCAVGYSLYVGGQDETSQLTELADIIREARIFQVPVIVWAYIRQRSRKKDEEGYWENVRYGARVAFELGADMVKLYYPRGEDGLKKIKEHTKEKKYKKGKPEERGIEEDSQEEGF
ncbi:Fructose-bisphosphate aldolase class 1 [subsurface metagenome]